MSGAIVSGEFNSPVLLEAEQEGTRTPQASGAS